MGRKIEADAVIHDKSDKGLRSVENNVRRSNEKIKKDYDRLGKGLGDGLINGIGKFSPKLAESITKSVGDGARLGAPLLLSGVGAALPALSGLIGSAVTGGAAGAGIIGGALLASRDYRVKAAGTQLSSNLLSGLTARAGTFVQPVLRSIDVIERKFAESGNTIESIFTKSSRLVVPLVESIGEATQDTLEGIEIAVGRSGPVMRSFNKGIEGTGEALKSTFDDLSANGEQNARVLDSAFDSLNGTLKVVGSTLGGISYVFGELDRVAPLSIFSTIEKLQNDGRRSSGGTFGPADDIRQVGDAAAEAEESTRLYERALEDNARAAEQMRDAQAGLFGSLTAVGEAERAFSEAIEDNGKTLSTHTEKGLENRRALETLGDSYRGYIDQLRNSGATSEEVGRATDGYRNKLIKAATQAGMNAGAARDLADAILGIPTKRKTDTELNKVAAQKNAKELRESINQIPRNVTTTVTVRVNQSQLNKVNAQLSRLERAGYGAAGGSFSPAGDMVSRVGGPARVSATIENRLYLDGTPMYAYTDRVVADERRRSSFRQRVGTR